MAASHANYTTLYQTQTYWNTEENLTCAKNIYLSHKFVVIIFGATNSYVGVIVGVYIL